MILILRWDLKQKSDSPAFSIVGHKSEIFSLDFNPFNEFLFLTGASDNNVGLWDLRNLKESLFTFEGHKDAVRIASLTDRSSKLSGILRMRLCSPLVPEIRGSTSGI